VARVGVCRSATSLSVRDPLVEFGLNVAQPETCRHVAQQPAQVGVRTRQRHSAIAIESQFAREELLPPKRLELSQPVDSRVSVALCMW
jgi:hypothetical protein